MFLGGGVGIARAPAGVLRNLRWTIDTDSFLIELKQQARREARPNAADRNELTLLCLKLLLSLLEGVQTATIPRRIAAPALLRQNAGPTR